MCVNTFAIYHYLYFVTNSAKRWAPNIYHDHLTQHTPVYLHKNCTVCSKHFETLMFLNDLWNRLHSHAVPTQVNVNNSPKMVTVLRPLPWRR